MIYTVGHSNHELDDLLGLLHKVGITMVIDVRSSPYSRRLPQFNRESLRRDLQREKIDYLFLGDKVGGRPADPSCYEGNRVCYARTAELPQFREGLAQVVELGREKAVSLLCAEDDPTHCHRMLLICRALKKTGVDTIRHIRRDGTVESQQEAESRLLNVFHLPPGHMFTSYDEMLDRAHLLQEEKLAYRAKEEEEAADDDE